MLVMGNSCSAQVAVAFSPRSCGRVVGANANVEVSKEEQFSLP